MGGIPDQDTSLVSRRFGEVADYLSDKLGVDVRYIPSADYSAVVVAFKNGDLHLGWFGGLTGVQARQAVPGSEAIAQRARDEAFHSKFIVQAGIQAESLKDLKGLTFTFGSESSTSGHLMPRYYLRQEGVDPETDFRPNGPIYSGSHDKTWKLVESGAAHAGALNEAVWQRAVDQGKVDLNKVRELSTTPAYNDYNWTIRRDVDEIFGDGFKDKVRQALLEMGKEKPEIVRLFDAQAFIPTSNGRYDEILEVATELGIVR